MKCDKALIVLSALPILSGCDFIDGVVEQNVKRQILVQSEQAEERLVELESQYKYLELQHQFLQAQVNNLRKPVATIRADADGYTITHTEYGALVLSPRGAKPYLDGFKFTVSIGNLSAATFNGGNVSVEWGPEFSTDLTWDEYRAARKEKQVPLTQSFAPGKYTDIELTLTPATATDLRAIQLSFEFDQISLNR